DVHQRPLDEIEQREKARVAAINQRIDNICLNNPSHDEHGALLSSIQIAKSLEAVENVNVDESFEEFQEEALRTKDTCLRQLKSLLVKAQEQEAQTAELERLRAVEEERKRKENEERIAREAAEK